jgi:hypothetical protein
MGNTCLLPLLTPRLPETVVGRVKSTSRSLVCGLWFSLLLLSPPSSPQAVHPLHRMCTAASWFRVAVLAGSGAELKKHFYRNINERSKKSSYEYRSGSLPKMCRFGVEASAGSAGARRNALRLPTPGAWRSANLVGAHSQKVRALRIVELYCRFSWSRSFDRARSDQRGTFCAGV